MGDEEEARPGQPCGDPLVVHGGHHRLSRPRGRDEEIPMLTLRAGELDLLEKSFLEGLEADLDRTQ